MSKEFWEAMRRSRDDEFTVRVKHEDTGAGWIALAIAFASMTAYQIAEKCL